MQEDKFRAELYDLIRAARAGSLPEGTIRYVLNSTAFAIGKAWDEELKERNAKRVAELKALIGERSGS